MTERENSLNEDVEQRIELFISSECVNSSETVVDIWIHTNELCFPLPSSSITTQSENIYQVDSSTPLMKIEPDRVDIPENESIWLSEDHQIPLERKDDVGLYSEILIDHDYCIKSSNPVMTENKTVAHSFPAVSDIKSEIKDQASTSNFDGLFQEPIVNSTKMNMQELATSLKDTPNKMLPLNIIIPHTFESVNEKRFPVLKNKRDCSEIFDLSRKSINSNSVDQNLKNSNSYSEMKNVEKIRQVPKSMKLDPAKSIVLTANYNEPALKISNVRIGRNPSANAFQRNSTLRVDPLDSHKCDAQDEDGYEFEENFRAMKKAGGRMSRRERFQRNMRLLDNVKFGDTLNLVKLMINQFPLISEDACDPEYKTLFPFVSRTREEFLSHNIGKQRSFEWQRARALQKLLKTKVAEEESWSVREIIIWARRHSYTPIPFLVESAELSVKEPTPSCFNRVPSSTFTESAHLTEWLSESSADNSNSGSDKEIDVVSEETPSKKKFSHIEKGDLDIFVELPDELQSLSKFVETTSRTIGIHLQDEEILSDVRYRAASHVIIQALQCFVEDLLRSSHAQAMNRSGNNNCTIDAILPTDVKEVLLGREEFDIFTNAGLGTITSEDD